MNIKIKELQKEDSFSFGERKAKVLELEKAIVPLRNELTELLSSMGEDDFFGNTESMPWNVFIEQEYEEMPWN